MPVVTRPQLLRPPSPGLANLWHKSPTWQAKRFPWHAAFTAVPISCYFFRQTSVCILWRIYTRCPGGNVPDFGRMFLKLKYTDITKNTYIRSWTVTEIMAREKCGFLAVLRTVPGSHDVLTVHCACPSFSLHSAQARSRWDWTYKVLGNLRTTTTLVRVFTYFNCMALCHSDVN